MTAFASGLLFGLGLALSGMTSPEKVYGFLDFLGAWDPTLVLVLGGAVVTHGLSIHLVRREGKALCRLDPPSGTQTLRDPKLVLGAGLFGVGWGLGGYCPGPALVCAGVAARQPLVFLAAMTLGILAAAKAADGEPGCG